MELLRISTRCLDYIPAFDGNRLGRNGLRKGMLILNTSILFRLTGGVGTPFRRFGWMVWPWRG
jgi:hypothetical protein